MIRKFKLLGLTMVAVLAMSAVVASAAQAQFTSSSYPTTITGTSALGNEVLTFEGSSLECASHFEGTMSETSTTIAIAAVYTNCKAFGFAAATFHMNGCKLVWHSNGSVDIECPAGKVIEIAAGNCAIHIGTQTGLKTISLSNNIPHIKIRFNIGGLTYYVTKDGFLCPLSGVGHKTTGTWIHGVYLTINPITKSVSIGID